MIYLVGADCAQFSRVRDHHHKTRPAPELLARPTAPKVFKQRSASNDSCKNNGNHFKRINIHNSVLQAKFTILNPKVSTQEPESLWYYVGSNSCLILASWSLLKEDSFKIAFPLISSPLSKKHWMFKSDLDFFPSNVPRIRMFLWWTTLCYRRWSMRSGWTRRSSSSSTISMSEYSFW